MALSQNLVSQFAKMANSDKPKDNGTTLKGEYITKNGVEYVKLDGSDILTPVKSTVEAENGEKVQVLLKDHTATIIGNISSPAARSKSVADLKNEVDTNGNSIKQLNTTVTQQQADITQINTTINQHNTTINQHETKINQQGDTITSLNNTVTTQGNKITAMNNDIEAQGNDISLMNSTIQQQGDNINSMNNVISAQGNKIDQQANTISQHGNQITQNSNNITQQGNTINQINSTITNIDSTITTQGSNINILNSAFSIKDGKLEGLSAAVIDDLETKNLNSHYAKIDFANINTTAVKKLFTESGIIKNLVVQDGHITGELVGVTIKGDLIEGNTIKADKLVVKGEDGIYYKLNLDGLNNISTEYNDKFILLEEEPSNWSIEYKKYYNINNNQYKHIVGDTAPMFISNTYYKLSKTDQQGNNEFENGLDGENIIAKSITASKITVNDLVAFGATIGGFDIDTHSIHSHTKGTINTDANGLFMDDTGQLYLGDQNNHLKYYLDSTDNKWKLDIRAAEIRMGTSTKTVAEEINENKTATDNITNRINDKENNYNFKYHLDITVNGDTNKFYPVCIKYGNQDVKRTILIKRGYAEKAPADWYTSTHKGGLTLKILANFGGWGGANYSWEIAEFEEMYSQMFGGAQNIAGNTQFAIFLRGGGETGAIYHLYSDQPLNAVGNYDWVYDEDEGKYIQHKQPSPQIAYDSDVIFRWSKDNGETITTTYNAPSPREMWQNGTLPDGSPKYVRNNSQNEEIRIRQYVKLSQETDKKVVKQTILEYYSSSSSLELKDGSWSTTVPDKIYNRYIWTRQKIIYSDGTSIYGTPVCSETKTGSRNLLIGTAKAIGDVINGNGTIVENLDLFDGLTGVKTNGAWQERYINLRDVYNRNGFQIGDTLTASVYIKADSNVTKDFYLYRANSASFADKKKTINISTSWQQIYFTFVATDYSKTVTNARIECSSASGDNYIYWAGWKLEKGNVPSDWSPAPEDTENTIQSLNTYVDQVKDNLQHQIDGAIQFWNGPEIPTLNNLPASEWITETDRTNHQADIYTVIQDVQGELKQGKGYRFDKVNNNWVWVEITDNELSAVQALATSKAKVFVVQPTVPYNIGDLWLKDNKLYKCKTSKDASGSYSLSDWELATDYTNDDLANQVQNNLDNLQVGTRNLLLGTSESFDNDDMEYSYGYWNIAHTTYDHGIKLEPDEEYILSFNWRLDWNTEEDITKERYFVSIGSGELITVVDEQDNILDQHVDYKVDIKSFNTITEGSLNYNDINKTQGSEELHFIPTSTQLSSYDNFAMRLARTTTQSSSNTPTFTIENLKLEKGTKKTDWSLAPEDIQNDTNNTNSAIDEINYLLNGNDEDDGIMGQISAIQQNIIEEFQAVKDRYDAAMAILENSIVSTIKSIGGNNVLHNSVGYNNLEFWNTSTQNKISTYQNDELSLSGSEFILKGGALMWQEVNIQPNLRYNLSCKIKHDTFNTPDIISIKIIQNDPNNTTTELLGVTTQYLNWTSVEVQTRDENNNLISGFIPNSLTTKLKIEISCGGDDNTELFEVTDLFLTIGESTMWSGHPDEVYGKEHLLDATGLTLKNINTNKYAHLTSTSLSLLSEYTTIAEISEQRLLSQNGIFLKSYQLGNEANGEPPLKTVRIDENNVIEYVSNTVSSEEEETIIPSEIHRMSFDITDWHSDALENFGINDLVISSSNIDVNYLYYQDFANFILIINDNSNQNISTNLGSALNDVPDFRDMILEYGSFSQFEKNNGWQNINPNNYEFYSDLHCITYFPEEDYRYPYIEGYDECQEIDTITIQSNDLINIDNNLLEELYIMFFNTNISDENAGTGIYLYNLYQLMDMNYYDNTTGTISLDKFDTNYGEIFIYSGLFAILRKIDTHTGGSN